MCRPWNRQYEFFSPYVGARKGISDDLRALSDIWLVKVLVDNEEDIKDAKRHIASLKRRGRCSEKWEPPLQDLENSQDLARKHAVMRFAQGAKNEIDRSPQYTPTGGGKILPFDRRTRSEDLGDDPATTSGP